MNTVGKKMQIVEVLLEDLKPYEKNPRKNEKSVDKVAESIKQFGFKVPIVIDKDNVIVTGHTRYLASKKLNLKTVPCLVADDLTDEQVKAFRLVDNKVSEFAEWDFELLNKELNELVDINIADFGFINIESIEWADIDEINEENYEQPKKDVLQCPKCNHVDSKERFKKVNE